MWLLPLLARRASFEAALSFSVACGGAAIIGVRVDVRADPSSSFEGSAAKRAEYVHIALPLSAIKLEVRPLKCLEESVVSASGWTRVRATRRKTKKAAPLPRSDCASLALRPTRGGRGAIYPGNGGRADARGI